MPSVGEIVERSLALLQRRGRVSHTALRLEFGLDDETLAALRAVRCGWEILRALEAAREVVEREFGLRLEARLAVATGATGNGAEAFGDVPRSAGTVQERSAADRLTVDAATREQAVAAFGFEPIADDLFAVAAPGCRDDHDGAAYAMSAATERLREHPHPQTEAAVQCAAATAAHVCGDQEGMLSASATALALATAVDLPDRRAFALGLHGSARVRAARPTPGSRSCAAPSPPRARPVRPRARRSCTGCWATRSPTGEPERARRARRGAAVGHGGERWYEPELHRMRAELLLEIGDVPGAQRSAGTAAALARRMRAGAWERRAAATLARLRGASPVSVGG